MIWPAAVNPGSASFRGTASPPPKGTVSFASPDGRTRIRIEPLQEYDFKGRFVRVRAPRSEVIEIGVPELFMIAQGFDSSDARRFGSSRAMWRWITRTAEGLWWHRRTFWPV